MTPERAAAGIVEVLAAQVAMSMRSVTIEKGYDPRDFILVAYGGAGPTVACPIAAELEIPEFCIPRDPGNFCAAGMLLTDLIRSYSLTRISALVWCLTNTLMKMRGHFGCRQGAMTCRGGFQTRPCGRYHARKSNAADGQKDPQIRKRICETPH